MVAVTKDLPIEQGAVFQMNFQWLQGADVETASPVDLTGWLGRLQIRKAQKTPVLVSATTTNGKITIVNAVEGRVRVKLTDEDTDLLTSRTCLYDLEMENPDGDVFRVMQGTVTVSPNITQEDDDVEVEG